MSLLRAVSKGCVFYSTRVLRAAFKPAERSDAIRKAEEFLRAPASSVLDGKSQTTPVDISHYNSLLQLYLEEETKFNPTDFLQTLSNKGIEANRVTYQRLIAKYCQMGDIDGATKILQHMKDKQLPVNEYVFNSLILGHGEANDMESAIGMISVMQQAGLEPNCDSYTALMCGYAKAGNIEEIVKIIKDCNEKDIFLYDKCIFDVVYALAKHGHDGLVGDVTKHLKKHTGFNQEAKNSIIKLCNIGKFDVAYDILKEMPRPVNQGKPIPVGNFFIKELVQNDVVPSEAIIKFCNNLAADDLNDAALNRACQWAFEAQKFERAFDLLEAMKSTHPLRQHYFWPFFALSSTEKEVYDGLKCMSFLKVSPSAETLRDYIIPALFDKCQPQEREKAIIKVADYMKIPVSVVATEAVKLFILDGAIQDACRLARRHGVTLNSFGLKRTITEHYFRTKNSNDLIQFIATTTDTEENMRQASGSFLIELANSTFKDRRSETMTSILKEFLDAGIGLSNSGAEMLIASISEEMNQEISDLISKLTSPELSLKPELAAKINAEDSYASPRSVSTSQIPSSLEHTTEQLESFLAAAIANKRPTKGIQKQLLFHYCRDRELEKAEKIRKELVAENFVFPVGLQALFLELYSYHGKLDEAREILKNINSTDQTFVLDDIKILRYALLLLTSGNFSECLEVVKNQPREEKHKPKGYNHQSLVFKMLNHLAEAGEVAQMKELFNLLRERGLTPINNMALGPLVKVHILKNDWASALAEFESLVKEHHCTPWKQELFCHYIKTEDAENLQKVLDLSTNLYGEINSLYDLSFAMIQCGKLRQAKKIYETPGFRARSDKLEYACEKFLQENRVEDLENLVKLTKDLFDVDRNSMYYYLLQAHCKGDNVEKALETWTSLQEENVEPTPEFLKMLAAFLEKHGKPVPFVIPTDIIESKSQEKTSKASSSNVQSSTAQSSSVVTSSKYAELKEALREKDLDKALTIKQRYESSGTSISFRELTDLVASLLKAERLGEATRITEEMLRDGKFPHLAIMRNLCGRLTAAGDVDALLRFKDSMSKELQRNILIDTRICSAYAVSGRGREYVENILKKKVEEYKPSENATDKNSSAIPAAGTYLLLMKEPELLMEFKRLAAQAEEKGLSNLNLGLWNYFLLTKDFSSAQEVFEKLKDEPRLVFRPVLREASVSKDEELVRELQKMVFTATSISEASKGAVSNTLVYICCANNKPEEALDVMREAEKYNIKTEHFSLNTLTALKELLEERNMRVPFNLPPKRTRTSRRKQKDSSSSSSDSDSD